jgi:hypothetical protein
MKVLSDLLTKPNWLIVMMMTAYREFIILQNLRKLYLLDQMKLDITFFLLSLEDGNEAGRFVTITMDTAFLRLSTQVKGPNAQFLRDNPLVEVSDKTFNHVYP